jgi:hypothetical protein
MGQLHSGDAPLFMNEPDDSTEHLDVPIVPNTEILRTDPSLGKDGGCLGKYQSSAANRTAPEMNQMPVSGVSVLTRILAHRRDENPIGKIQISNREGIKQASHLSYQLSVVSYQVFVPDPPILKVQK